MTKFLLYTAVCLFYLGVARAQSPAATPPIIPSRVWESYCSRMAAALRNGMKRCVTSPIRLISRFQRRLPSAWRRVRLCRRRSAD